MKRVSLRAPLSPTWLLAVAVLAQLVLAIPLLHHTSTDSKYLSRFSARYALALAVAAVIAAVWVILFSRRRLVVGWLTTQAPRWGLALIIVSGAGMALLWLLPIEDILQQYVAVNWFLLVLLVLAVIPDRPAALHHWPWLLLGVVGLMLLPLFVGALSDRRFSPDEGVWADLATTPYVGEGLYSRTHLEEPITITPGRGWSSAAYGWLLVHVSFDITVGRAWNFAAYVLAFIGIGAVTWRMYGRRAAVISASLAVFSLAFIPEVDYRTHHQLPAASMLILFCAVHARDVSGRQGRMGWHFVTGLLSTLALQLHAAAIVFAAAFSAYYVIETVPQTYRTRRLASLGPLVAFGLGALLGTAAYYAFNIHPVGGVATFLDLLSERRTVRLHWFPFLRWNSWFEAFVAWSALGYIALRRNDQDRFLLRLFVLLVVADVLLDMPGYFTVFSAVYMVPVGTFLVDGLKSVEVAAGHSRRLVIAVASLIAVMLLQMYSAFYSPAIAEWFRTRALPPYLYEQIGDTIRPHISDDDVVLGAPMLIWGLPDHPNLVSEPAEPIAAQRWNLDTDQVWERIHPTVIVNVGQESLITPALQGYMDRHGFHACQTWDHLELEFSLLRASCPGEP